MKAKYISYQETNSFSKLVLDYLNNEDLLKPFYGFRPHLDGLKQALETRNFKGNRAELVQVIHQQYQNIETSLAVKNNISLLAEEHTFTVTTGHQLNIFTGPLYFIYKIVTAINLANELKTAYPEKNFVPVYWMATEDHDFEEINHVSLEGKNISWTQDNIGATGRLNTKSIASAVMAYKSFLGISENGQKLAKLIEDAYLKHHNLADATRALVNSLFETYGLIILDADDVILKKQFASIIKEDITTQKSAELTEKTSEELTKSGYKSQVNGRDINFFYLTDNLRERIIEKDLNYTINHTELSFTKDELLAEIENHPERFSPNVIMRPLYQEVILPNIAYIGGGAEVAYWMQLKANFEHYQIDFPVLLLRNSALLIDQRSAENLNKLGFKPEVIFLSTNELQEIWIKNNSENKLSLAKEINAIQTVFDQLKINIAKVDQTLETATDAAKTKANHLLTKLEKKIFKAEKKKHSVSLKQIENVKHRLFPGGTLQERVVNLAPMYINYGDDFIASLIENFEPLGGEFTLLLASS